MDVPAALRAVLPALACPVCGADLAVTASALRCESGHGFDLARQGYVSLRSGDAASTGDSAAMVAAREAFLASGHLDPLREAVTAAALRALAVGASTPLVLDVGAGTGWYLQAVLDAAPGIRGLALDASRSALRRAARAHPRAAAVGCDVWRGLPLRDRTAALALVVFAPRNAGELDRVLTADGAVVAVTPTAAHLHELVGALGLLSVEEAKQERLRTALAPAFAPVDEVVHRQALRLDGAAVAAVVGMGPSAWHLDPEDLAGRMDRLPPQVEATAEVAITTFRRP
jgi:23S rRNA (guanine745-N1)-methyltransferase